MRRRLAARICLAALASVVFAQLAGSGDASAAEGPRRVCEIVRPLEEILCPDDGAPGGTEQPGGDATGATGTTAPETADESRGAGQADALDPRLKTPPSVPLQYDPRRIVVSFEPGTSDEAARTVLAAADVAVENAIPAVRAYVGIVDPERRAAALAELRSSRRVADADPEVIAGAADTTPNDRFWTSQAGLRLAAFPRAWDITRGSSAVVVAVLDTGVDSSHPDLAEAVVPGYDFVNRDADPADDEGHGTAVAGVIAARGNNGEGVAGACWACRVMPVKVLDATGSGSTSTVAAGIVWAADRGASVINLSLGSPGNTAALSDAVAYAVRKGVLVVAAAGNNGAATPFYPAAEPGVLGVAATDLEDHLYSWSNRGAWVRIAAPGCTPTAVPGGYGNLCGTSAAAPLVGGLAALARTANPDGSAVEIERTLEETVVRIQADVRSGRIDAGGALTRLVGPPPSQPKADPPLRTTVKAEGVVTPPFSVSYSRAVGAGRLTATVGFAGKRLTLALISPDGFTSRVSGAGPLRLERTVAAGTARVAISGAGRRTPFVLTLDHVSAPRRRVSITRIPSAPAVTGQTVLASIGRPRVSSPHVTAVGVLLEDAEEREPPIVQAINAVRQKRGLPELRVSTPLATAADAHAASMGLRGYFAHEWADGTSFQRWILRYYPALGGRAWLAGENLVWASPALDPKRAVNAWLASPPHRRNLLDPRWREIGIGVVRARRAGGVYGGHDVEIGVADFGRR